MHRFEGAVWRRCVGGGLKELFTLTHAAESVLCLNEDVVVAAAEAAIAGEVPRLRQRAPGIGFAQHQMHVLAGLQTRTRDIKHQDARISHLEQPGTTII